MIAGLLIATAFVMVPSPVNATIHTGPDERGIYIYYESLDYQSIYVGDKDISFYIRIVNGDDDEYTDDDPIRHCNMSIDQAVRDADGMTVESPIANWDTREVNADATLYDGSSPYTFSGFQFDVKADAKPMYYNLTVRMSYHTDDNQSASFYGYIHFDISPRASLDDIYDLYPGDKKKGISVHVDVYSTLKDARLYLTAPSGFSWFGSSTQTISAFRSGSSYYDWYVPFSISVDEGLRPNMDGYMGTYRLEYEDTYGLNIAEEGEVAFHVNALPMLSASMEIDEFIQGTTATILTITVKNTGNVDLYEGKVWINSVSTAFIFTASDHYEGSSTVSYSRVDIGDLRMSDETTAEFSVVVDTFIPEGKHKILMDFSGYFYDPVYEIYRKVYTWWTSGTQGYYPVVNIDSSNVYLDPDSSSVEGMYGNLQVIDESAEVRVQSSTVLDLGGQLYDNWMYIYVENYGNIDYDNVVLKMETNTEESPFLNPIDSDSPVSEDIMMSDSLRSGRTYTLVAHLSIKPGTEPGVYLVPMTMTGINSDTGRVFSTDLEARITLRGMGPRLKITDVSPSEVNPGDDFTLKLKVTNVGDDTAWGAVLSVPPKVTEKEGVSSGVEDAVSTPEPEALPIYLGAIAPGEERVIEIPMKCSASTKGGQVYPFYFSINCTDSYGFHPEDDSLNYAVAIKTQSSLLDSSWLILIIVVCIGVLVIFAIAIMTTRGRSGEPKPPKPKKEKKSKGAEPAPQQDAYPTVEHYDMQQQPPIVIADTPKKDLPPPPPDFQQPPAKGKAVPSTVGQAMGNPPSRPIYLNGFYEDGKIKINWREPLSDDAAQINKYKILRWGAGSEMEELAEVAKVLEYEDTTIEAGVTYNYAVQALTDAGQSEASKSIEVKTV